MMVVVAIIMILTGAGAVALNNFNNNQKLEGGKGELISDLKLSRNMAITIQSPEGISEDIEYVLVTINNGIITSSGISDGSSENYFSKSNNVFNDMSESFGFSVENGRLTDGDGILTSDNLCLELYLSEDDDDKKYVVVNSSGLVYEENCSP
jgi:Tfp pilus assembly protein FimT